jgi:hypothetical protein
MPRARPIDAQPAPLASARSERIPQRRQQQVVVNRRRRDLESPSRSPLVATAVSHSHQNRNNEQQNSDQIGGGDDDGDRCGGRLWRIANDWVTGWRLTG